MIKNLPILLFLQAVLSFQPLQKNGRPRTSVYQSTPSIEAPCWNVTTLGRNLFQGIFDQQHTSVESRNGAFSNEKHRNANSFESAEVLNNLRSKSTIDLKLLCSKRSIRYAGLVEKEEFVQAIVNNMKELQDFSHSGQLYPGSVNEISSDILDKELDSDVPILLDVYATFCGPCKLLRSSTEVDHSMKVKLNACFYRPQASLLYQNSKLPQGN